jgi:ribosomal protein L11 methyltransferase
MAMFELSLLCPEDRVETISEALDALDALSVSVEDADAQTEAEQALFGEPGMPAPKEGWNRSRVIALYPDEAAATEARDLLLPQDFLKAARFWPQARARAGLGAPDAVAVRARGYHARVLDRAHLA